MAARDMARMDEEGYYYIVDRKKDLIISGGVNIYPGEIDEVIQKHHKVLEVAVIGVPNEVWGESIKAVVVLKKGEEATEEEIKKFCEGKGVYRCIQCAAPVMREKRYGKIINLSSGDAEGKPWAQLNYSAAKAGEPTSILSLVRFPGTFKVNELQSPK